MAFFSIVIPTYNRAELISNTILSVQQQSFIDWECIVVDDGSTDNTRFVIENIIAADGRIKYFYQENAERSAARNNGILKSTGEYVCFLDSDDLYKSNHLSVLFEEIQSLLLPRAMFFTNYEISSKDGLFQPLFPNLNVTPEVLMYLFYNPIIPARVCIHKSILENEKFDIDIVIVEDLLLWVKIAIKHLLYHVEKTTVIYTLHDDNSINLKNNSASKRLAGLQLFKTKYPEILKLIPSKIWHDVIGDTHFNIMKFHLYNQNISKALKHLLLSIFYQRNHSQLKHKIFILSKIVLMKRIHEYSK